EEIEARECLIIVLHVHRLGHSPLLQVTETALLAGLLARLRENGKQDGSQEGDDGDNDEQFNQGEPARPGAGWSRVGLQCHGSAPRNNVQPNENMDGTPALTPGPRASCPG